MQGNRRGTTLLVPGGDLRQFMSFLGRPLLICSSLLTVLFEIFSISKGAAACLGLALEPDTEEHSAWKEATEVDHC